MLRDAPKRPAEVRPATRPSEPGWICNPSSYLQRAEQENPTKRARASETAATETAGQGSAPEPALAEWEPIAISDSDSPAASDESWAPSDDSSDCETDSGDDEDELPPAIAGLPSSRTRRQAAPGGHRAVPLATSKAEPAAAAAAAASHDTASGAAM